MAKAASVRIKETPTRIISAGAFQSSYLAWGYFHTLVAFIWIIKPGVGFSYPSPLWPGFGFDFFLASSGIHALVGFFLLKIPVPFSPPMAFLLLSQAWICVSAVVAAASLGRMPFLGNFYLWPMYFVLPLVSFSMIFFLEPRAKTAFIRCLFAVLTISLVVAVLQFAGVGFARALITNPDITLQTRFFRPPGLVGFPSMVGFHSLLIAGYLVSKLLHRPWKLYEFVAFGALSCLVLIAQYRSLYFGLLVLVLLSAYLYYRFSKPISFTLPVSILFVGALFATLFPDKMEYALNPQFYFESAEIRQAVSYDQVEGIIKNFPWTGIGMDSTLATSIPDQKIGKDKWVTGVADSSYNLVWTTTGYPGLVLLIATFLFSTLGLIAWYRSRGLDPVSKERVFLALFSILLLAYGSLVASFILNRQLTIPISLFLALLAPSASEYVTRIRENNSRPSSSF